MDSMHRFNSLRRDALVMLVLMSTGGCGSATALGARGEIEVVARDERIEITNRTARPVFTFVIGRQASVRSLWVPCVDVVSCPPLPPGSTTVAPYPAWVGEHEAIVYWWHAVLGLDGVARPDSIRARVVVLTGRDPAE